MKSPTLALALAAIAIASASAQYSTPPATAADKEAAYTLSIQSRTQGIVSQLELNDAAKSNKVTDIILAQYRALRARDEAIAAKLKAQGKDATGPDRAALFRTESKTLHDKFLADLAAELSPEQVEKVKDGMTYNKVKVTYDAYGAIIPGLTDSDKAKITELLKQAREEAIDGGSAKEKSDIFQKFKDQINEYLNAHGHDVAKAYEDWNAKQAMASKEKDGAAPKPQ